MCILTLVFLDTFEFLAPVPLVVFIFVVIAHAGSQADINSKKDKCENFEIITNYKTKYIQSAGDEWSCYANVDGRWIPSNQIVVNPSPTTTTVSNG